MSDVAIAAIVAGIAAIISAVVAAVGALTGVVVSQWFTEQTRRHIAAESATARQADREAEHRTWKRDRRADAYAHLLHLAGLSATSTWSHVYRIQHGHEIENVPTPPTRNQMWEAMAIVDVVGSRELYQMTREWHRLHGDLVDAANDVNQNPDSSPLRSELDYLNKRQSDALEKLGIAMQEDLDRTPDA